MTLDAQLRDLARSLVAVGTPPVEVLDILIGQAWAAVLVTCHPDPTLLSDILTEMAGQLDRHRLQPCVARTALASAGIHPLLLALHANRICGGGDPLALGQILARALGVPEDLVERLSTGWWTPTVYFPLPFPDLGIDWEGLSEPEVQALRGALGEAHA